MKLKFFPLELYFQNTIRSSILDQISFIGELERSRTALHS
ncbi:hypothetical protein MMC2321_02427 [Chitinophaga sp. MM2321]